MAIVEAVEDAWDERFLAETDKLWESIHRVLGDGTLNPAAGSFPLNRAILGGRHLHHGDTYIVAFVSKEEVPAVARRSLRSMTQACALAPEYLADVGAHDRDATVEYFAAVSGLYAVTAREGRAVIFTVDQ